MNRCRRLIELSKQQQENKDNDETQAIPAKVVHTSFASESGLVTKRMQLCNSETVLETSSEVGKEENMPNTNEKLTAVHSTPVVPLLHDSSDTNTPVIELIGFESPLTTDQVTAIILELQGNSQSATSYANELPQTARHLGECFVDSDTIINADRKKAANLTIVSNCSKENNVTECLPANFSILKQREDSFTNFEHFFTDETVITSGCKSADDDTAANDNIVDIATKDRIVDIATNIVDNATHNDNIVHGAANDSIVDFAADENIVDTAADENIVQHDHLSGGEEIPDQTKRKGKKRTRNVNQWKRNIAKSKRLKGEEYTSASYKCNTIIKHRILQPACDNCSRKCSTKVTHLQREKLHNSFWKSFNTWDQRNQYIADSVKVSDIARERNRNGKRKSARKTTRAYFFNIDGKVIDVCQCMFLCIFSISEKYVSNVLRKRLIETGIVSPDNQGCHAPSNLTNPDIVTSIKNHIESFPCYESHYTRAKTNRKYLGPELNLSLMYNMYATLCSSSNDEKGSEWLYRKVFNEQYNMSFHPPTNDTCDTCDKIRILLEDATTEVEKESIKQKKEDHLKEAEIRYMLKSKDKKRAEQESGCSVLMMDMQKCLPTPSLKNCQSFYLRKLWVLNETIYDSGTGEAYCMMWDETIAARGGNEVASCVYKWCMNYMSTETICITLWTDNCIGQNRNIMLVYCYMLLVSKLPNLKMIDHKYILKGHTHLEVDMVHSVIEKKKKQLNDFEISIPHDWEQFVKTVEINKKHCNVAHLSADDFLNFSTMSTGIGSPLVTKRKDVNGDQFLISQAVWLRVQKETPGKLFYKTSFNEDSFKVVDLRRNSRKNLQLPETIPPLRKSVRPLKTAKFNDLLTLNQWIPAHLRDYYRKLPHSSVASEFPETDEVLENVT